MSLPTTVGLCPDPPCTAEFYMPDAKPGDRCPMHHGESDDAPLLVIYAPLADAEAWLRSKAQHGLADFLVRRFGGGER